MADEPRYTPGLQRQPGDLLFSFVTGDDRRVTCKLRVHAGVWEAQVVIAGDLHTARTFVTREGAERWAAAERLRFEREF